MMSSVRVTPHNVGSPQEAQAVAVDPRKRRTNHGARAYVERDCELCRGWSHNSCLGSYRGGAMKEVTRHISTPVQCMLWGRAAGRGQIPSSNKPLRKTQ